MSEKKSVRRMSGRGPAAKTDRARERLLETARDLFGRQGVDEVTVRDLAEAANVNVAAVNYYFGSKDGLLLVLFRREAKLLVEQRLERLREAEASTGSQVERLELFVRALLEPVIRWCLQPHVRSLYVPTLLRAAAHGGSELRSIIERESQDLQHFASALGRMLPANSLEETYWRLHYLLGLEHSLISDLPRLKQLSNGLCDTTDVDRIVTRTVAFALHGLVPSVAVPSNKRPVAKSVKAKK
jgi:AcrR family transcriptional regulator